MATAQIDARMKAGGTLARNTRRNEIIAIALFALSALLAFCLVSYSPDDPSWVAASASSARNWTGRIGANVAAALFQSFGLAAALLPLLLVAAAWRRFRTRRIHAPLSRIIGLAALTLAIASLLALYVSEPLFDRSFNAGGFVGVLVAENLKGVLNTVGATVMLIATASVGLLLATNFSFVTAYERASAALANPSGAFRKTLERFQTWRAARRAQALARAEMRREARAAREVEEQTAALTASTSTANTAGPAVSVTRGSKPESGPAAAIKRNADAAPAEEKHSREEEIRAQLARAEADLASIIIQPAATPFVSNNTSSTTARKSDSADVGASSRRVSLSPEAEELNESTPVKRQTRETPDVSEMLSTAAVVRTEVGEDAEDLPFERNIPPTTKASEREATRRAEVKAIRSMLDYGFPSIEYLNPAPPRREQADEELLLIAQRVAEKCKEFNVTGQIKHICPGPVVTTYEFKPDPGVKYSRVTGLVDDLCIALEAESIRIDRLPGKPHVGIEVPNPERETIFMREVLESRQFRESESKLTLALGKTIDGINYVADLTRMPHLLIAGATGTGKSVCLNSLVVSILYKARPDEVKFIMIDPKRLELGLYADIPHLATPIITEPKKAANALKWAVGQMEQRYKQLAQWGVRNIDGYNAEVERRNNVLDFDEGGQPWKTLPYIVIIIDELADLMMTCGTDVEEAITRLAQMARAVGIHLVLATQRPSVDVITGLIKANFPSRIAFRVSQKVDSRTIIDANGAEQLLGRGDMLFLPPGTSRLLRVHGAYLDENEVAKIVAHIKTQGGAPVYDETITQSGEESANGEGGSGERDELFDQALRICCEMKRASTSVLQRRLRIGYGRAAAILDAMERDGFIGQADGARPRPVLQRAFETIGHWDDLQENSAEEF
ncbi:MAG: segregation ATPase FtsK/SpoIIIE, family [Acidobacteriota bacterium]|jgi:S-DNA-T family DNA segregation ATPase FtsK/SpoIIIE|nr:segregation ATPase FtsK/SpoIIIE, family [Acidobacteriota bacterium]